MAVNPDKNIVEQSLIARLIGKIKRIALDMGDSVTAETSRAQAAEGLKADKVHGATAGNFAALDASGNLTDSGSKVADFKTKQTPVSDPSASGAGLEFIDSISQNANGEITPHKKSVQDGTTAQKGVVKLSNAIDSTSVTEAATPKAVKDAYDELNNKIVARAVFLSQEEWAVQSQLPGDPAKVYYVENGTGEDAYTVYVWKESTSTYEEVDESSIDLDGYWHDSPTTTGNGNVVTNITLGNDGVPQVEKGMSAEPAFSVLPVNKGGTGANTIKGALSTLTSETQHYDTLPTDDTLIVHKFGTSTASNGALYTRKLSYLWTYIQNKISSVLGLTASSYGGNAATATSAGKLTASKTIAISGGATGTATAFDGSANITIPVTKLGFGTNNAVSAIPLGYNSLTGPRSGDDDSPYVRWNNIAGKAFTVGGATYYGYVLNSNSSATFTYGGNSVTINNTTSRNWVVLVIDDSTYIGSASLYGHDRCSFTLDGIPTYRRLIANNYAIGSAYAVAVNVGSDSFTNATTNAKLLAPCATNLNDYSGTNSVASGANSVASGNYSVASGTNSVASGNYSVASGASSVASGTPSVASGTNSVASGNNSVASGASSVAYGTPSVASGTNSIASGTNSIASGNNSVASGTNSVASGNFSVSQHTGSHVCAYKGISGNDYQHVVGKWNVMASNRAFVVGWGTAENARKNVMSVGTDGEIYFKESNTGLSTQLANKLGSTGDASNTTSTFTKASGDTSSMTSGSKLSVLFTAISSFFASLKALAFKDKVSDSDISGTISDSHISSASTWNGKQNVVSTDTDSSAFGDDTAIATGFSSDKLHLNVASRLWNYIRGKILGWYDWTRVDSGTGRYAKICSIADPASGTSYTVDVLVTHTTSYYAVTGLVRITVSHGSSSVQASILASDSLFYAVDSGNPPKVYTYVDGNGKRTFVFDTASAYQTAQGFVFMAVGGFSDKWSFFGDVGCSNDAADLGSIGTKQDALDVTFVFANYAKTAGHAATATSAGSATNATNADYAYRAGSAANYESGGGIADALAGKSNTSHVHDDRYVRFDTNSQGLNDTQKSNARTNIGAGTSSLTLGTTSNTAARGNHAHGLLDREGYLSDQNWAVSNLDCLVITKNNYNGKVGYLVPSDLFFDSDEKNKALTQSAEWKTFLPPNGDGSSVSVTPDGTSTGTDIGDSTTLKVWAQKFKNLVSGLGRAAYKNTPMNGWNASSSEVVMGNDTRLTDARTPTSHASTGTTYGAGTTANYGHVKLLNGDLNGISYANGVAAASAHTHSQYLTSHQDISGKVDYTLINDASVIGNNAPAADCKTYWSSSSMPDNRVKVLYNVPGNEATILFSKRSSYGSILKYGYADRYLYLLRNQSGTWKSTDWEKIYAGYADSAGNAESANYAVGASNYNTDGNIASRFNAIDSNIASLQTSTSGDSAVVKLTGSGWSIQGEVSVYNGSGRYSYTSRESANTLWLEVLNYKVRSILLVGDCTGNSTSKFVLSALGIGNTILVAVMNRSSSELTLSFRYNADGNTQFTLFIPSTGASTKTDYGISIPSKECKTFVLSRVEATYFMLKEL